MECHMHLGRLPKPSQPVKRHGCSTDSHVFLLQSLSPDLHVLKIQKNKKRREVPSAFVHSGNGDFPAVSSICV